MSTTNLRVLIIDDDPEDTLLFKDALLEVFPYADCDVKNDGSSLEQYTTPGRNPDVIFIDANMFPVSGLECLRAIRASGQFSRAKIIIYSGALSPEQINDFKASGATDVMTKARSYSDLKATLSRLLSPQPTQQNNS